MLVMEQIEQFLVVQELQLLLEGMYWDTAIAKNLPRSDFASDGDWEHSE